MTEAIRRRFMEVFEPEGGWRDQADVDAALDAFVGDAPAWFNHDQAMAWSQGFTAGYRAGFDTARKLWAE